MTDLIALADRCEEAAQNSVIAHPFYREVRDALRQAADRIAALEAEARELAAEVETASHLFDLSQKTVEAVTQRAERAEAERDALRAAKTKVKPLLDLVEDFTTAVFYLLDNSETSGSIDDPMITVLKSDFDEVSGFLDRIEGLPSGSTERLGAGELLSANILAALTPVDPQPVAQESDLAEAVREIVDHANAKAAEMPEDVRRATAAYLEPEPAAKPYTPGPRQAIAEQPALDAEHNKAIRAAMAKIREIAEIDAAANQAHVAKDILFDAENYASWLKDLLRPEETR